MVVVFVTEAFGISFSGGDAMAGQGGVDIIAEIVSYGWGGV